MSKRIFAITVLLLTVAIACVGYLLWSEKKGLAAENTITARTPEKQRPAKIRIQPNQCPPEPGEVVYVSDGQVRTRRWTWRQSEVGKITPETRDLLFPIDGFTSLNLERVLAARAELAEGLERYFGAKTAVGLVDRDNCVFEAEL